MCKILHPEGSFHLLSTQKKRWTFWAGSWSESTKPGNHGSEKLFVLYRLFQQNVRSGRGEGREQGKNEWTASQWEGQWRKETGRVQLRGKDPRMGLPETGSWVRRKWAMAYKSHNQEKHHSDISCGLGLRGLWWSSCPGSQPPIKAKEECNMEAPSWKDSITWLK